MLPDLPLTLYVDRACPLCAREVRWLERQADPARLLLVDISAADFDTDGLGRDQAQLRRRLHARSASGQWLTGVDATYWSWRLAGHGFWAAPLGWKLLRPLLLPAYGLFSVLRPHLDWLPHPDGSSRCGAQCRIAQPPSSTSDRPEEGS
ncbi:DUF393 domain-containing protein [Pseudomonas stutzeri]|uniref:thiol-disulfide oxidoreductase DCC family protein n=1 Tax=Stutzerimonas stutzeri TaxID=316 RepID=UPI001909DDE4|nr:DUF393 domain-containing protein [Stutzerimonas stutzeri]MBK3867485.1 DUF393 domain-containing protein [Stutzerimonas stutzeri]